MTDLYETIRKVASQRILDALENGDATEEAAKCRAEIKLAWLAALEGTGAPDNLTFPL